MTVSLKIHWSDREWEEVPIGGHDSVKNYWGTLGKDLGLNWVPRFYSWIPIDKENLDEVLQELRTFRPAVAQKWQGDEFTLERVDGLIEALERLKRSSGWDADIG